VHKMNHEGCLRVINHMSPTIKGFSRRGYIDLMNINAFGSTVFSLKIQKSSKAESQQGG